MNLHGPFGWLLVGIVCVLSLSTVVGRLLARRAKTPGAQATTANLRARIRGWWVMVLVMGLALWLGSGVTIAMFAACSFLALREFITLTPTRRSDHLPLALAFFVLVPAQYLLIASHWYGLFAVFIPVYAFLLLPAFAATAGDTRDFLDRSAKIQWGVMVAVYCVSYVPALLMLRIPGFEGREALLVCFLVLVVQLSDVLQYVFGKLLGRTPMAPGVSPAKTLEGLLCGGLGAVLAGGALWWITPFSPCQALALSGVIVLAGCVGGLVLSAVKRSLGAKDWGNLIEGHGGMLDRIDSISFSAPLFFHLTRYFFVA